VHTFGFMDMKERVISEELLDRNSEASVRNDD